MQEYINQMSTMMMTGEETDDREFVSDCCGAKTSEPDRDGLAICLDCKDHCSVEPVIEEPWADTLEEANE